MGKVLITDLDGTLLDKGQLPHQNKSTISKFKKNKKNILVVNTGRSWADTEFLIDKHNLEVDYFFLLNGALVIDSNKKELYKKNISTKTIIKIVQKYSKIVNGITCTDGYHMYILKNGNHNYTFNNSIMVDKLVDIENNKLSSLSLYVNANYIKDLVNDLKYNFGKEVDLFISDLFIDIVPKGISKGNAVKHVENVLNIDNANIFAIGDSYNDIPMFEYTKNSFTFFNSCIEVKKAAQKYITDFTEIFAYIK